MAVSFSGNEEGGPGTKFWQGKRRSEGVIDRNLAEARGKYFITS